MTELPLLQKEMKAKANNQPQPKIKHYTSFSYV
jgi:hypothetical protein